MSDKQVQTTIRPALISDILNKKFEPTSSARKQELKEELINLFYKYDGVAFADVNNRFRTDRTQLTDAKKQAKRLSTLREQVSKLDASTSSSVLSWATNKGILIPDTVPKSEYKSYLMKIYEEKINSIKAEIDRLDASVKGFDEALKACNEQLKKFNQTNKTDYTNWKNECLNENAKIIKDLRAQLKLEVSEEKKKELENSITSHDDFKYLSEKYSEILDKLSLVQREQFRLRLEKDKISSKMFRFASTNKHLAYYCNKILQDLVDNIVREYVDQIFDQDKDKLRSTNYKFPAISADHIIPMRFEPGPISDIYRGLLCSELKSLGEVNKETKLYKYVKTIVTNTLKTNTFTAKSDEKIYDVIYRVLVRFINYTSSLISAAVKKDGIKTFQEKIIVNLFTYTFGAWGDKPYTEPKPKKK